MCLAAPGKIVFIDSHDMPNVARVQFGDLMRRVSLDFLPGASVGDYITIHLGFAISLVGAEQADRTYRLRQSLVALEDEQLAPEGPSSDN